LRGKGTQPNVGGMRPGPDEVLHFSEDPTIRVDNLWPWSNAVVESTVEFSGIRLHNAALSRPA
jgi:hypothetical protein